MLRVRCPRCEKTVTAADEDQLVKLVRLHVREDPGFVHPLPAKHILEHLGRQTSREK